MQRSILALGVLFAAVSLAIAQPMPSRDPAIHAKINDQVETQIASLVELYKHFHSHAELSLQEEQTGLRLGKELREAGLEVTTRFGGHGVVGVFKNGDGPTVMIRGDMDALPIIEQTNLPYASKVRTRDAEGREVGTMHACGHDINITALVGTARTLVALKKHWRGTLLFVGQPAEEIGAGAKAMLEAGLFEKFPRPQFGLALHCDGRFPHGTVNFREGQMQANVDSVDITLLGKGGHGAAPHATIDPVVLAARVVLDLQTIVSRERNPLDPVVVTVGSIHGGTKHNIIPSEVKLQLTVRTTNDRTRKEVLEAIVRITKAAAMGARAPEPIVRHNPEAYTPALVNEPKFAKRIVGLFKDVLGEGKVVERGMSLGGEDFSRFTMAGVTTFYYHLGTVDPRKHEASLQPGGVALPSTHSPFYAPVPEPTLRTGVFSMTVAVLDLVGKS